MFVSVVIPSFNHERYIEEAARSVLDQTHSRLELIVVDDGSTDGSVARLKQIQDPRLNLIVQENCGAHAAINRGMELARGDYLAILNSDDAFHPERLAKMLRALKVQEAAFACSFIEIVDGHGNVKGIKRGWESHLPGWALQTPATDTLSAQSFARNLLVSNFISTTSNMLFRRELLETVGGFRNLRFTHDWDFALRVAADWPCVMVEEPLMRYRLHGSNTITSNRRWMLFEACWVLAANVHRFERTLSLTVQRSDDVRGTVDNLGRPIGIAGCERVMWLLHQFITAQRESGVACPGEHLLEDHDLRNQFMEFIPEL